MIVEIQSILNLLLREIQILEKNHMAVLIETIHVDHLDYMMIVEKIKIHLDLNNQMVLVIILLDLKKMLVLNRNHPPDMKRSNFVKRNQKVVDLEHRLVLEAI